MLLINFVHLLVFTIMKVRTYIDSLKKNNIKQNQIVLKD